MTVTLDLGPEIEEGLLTQARARGVSVDDYLREIVSRQVRNASPAQSPAKSLKLPAVPLGDLGSLHRRDIYEDAS
jgi:hypothetical protein